MKKIVMIVGIVILSIIGIYALFVIEESVRLSNNLDAKPLIVISEKEKSNDIETIFTYNSLGFRLTNRVVFSGTDEEQIIGQELWMFDVLMLWGWIS